MATQIWDSLVNTNMPISFIRTRNTAGVWSEWGQLWTSLNTPKQTSLTDQTAGAMLTVGSFGAGLGFLSTETNLNNYKVPGNYLTPLAGMTNLPEGWSPSRRYSLVVEGYSANNYLVQRITDGLPQGATPMVAMRLMQTADQWTEWYVIPASNTLPFRGTVAFKTAGVTSWVVPPFVKKAWVTVIGAGGGGGFSASASGIGSGGGGGGGLSQRLVDLTGVTSVTVTVGAGGAGATVSGGTGSTGGTSSFGAYLSATGGLGGGGNNSNGNAPGSGGRGSGGEHNTSLGVGSPNYGVFGGAGGGPGPRSTQSSVAGNSAIDAGGGGSGAYVGNAGGNGADGCVIIQW